MDKKSLPDIKKSGFEPYPIKHKPQKAIITYNDYVLWFNGEKFVKLPATPYVEERWL